MKIVMFYHSLLSDWNNGNAHFLRGLVSELLSRGDSVEVFEPEDGWSLNNLIKDYGADTLIDFSKYYPRLKSKLYSLNKINLEEILANADAVIVHEWNEPELIKKIGEVRKKSRFKLLLHDTHHLSVTNEESIGRLDLSSFDGVLAFGEVIKNIYLKKNWIKKAWTFHEAADVRIFLPINRHSYEGDLVWIGNWGDEERTEEIHKYLIEPVKKLKLKCKVYGVRYPKSALETLEEAGIEYGGWLPNYKVPEVFSKYKFTIHIPRNPYAEMLPGIPTIRPFEAMASGIPLISTYWEDSENLFKIGEDFLMVNSPDEMKKMMKLLLNDNNLSQSLTQSGLKTIHSKHTCAHRADSLYLIFSELGITSNKTIEESF
jgi:spore maturation protein CgeB